MPAIKDKLIATRLSTKDYSQLYELAEAEDMTISQLLRQLAREWVQRKQVSTNR